MVAPVRPARLLCSLEGRTPASENKFSAPKGQWVCITRSAAQVKRSASVTGVVSSESHFFFRHYFLIDHTARHYKLTGEMDSK